MEVCKNKNSNKLFVYLQDIDGGQLLLITPEGNIKKLNRSLFSAPFEVDKPEDFVNDLQIKKHESYKGDIVASIMEDFSELSESEKKRLLSKFHKKP